jgi:transglutaminase-like putative cysteine protease
VTGWRIRVVHATGYRYAEPVGESYNEVRLTPGSGDRQQLLASRVETTPPTRSYRYTDYWGTVVTVFDLHAPHTELAVVATSVVQTAGPAPPVRGAGWAELAEEGVRDRFAELLEHADGDPELTEVARTLRRGADPVDAVLAACRWVREHLTYQPGSTGAHTSPVEAWRAGRGVCQDHAHLTVLLLREMGVPARYVVGYLLPRADTEVGQTVSGEYHAWVQAWTGGWWGHDPTDDVAVGHRHVWVAAGRDHADVAAIKGVYSGGAATALDVTVDMTRLA